MATNKKFQFKNDNHWNEYENLELARNIKNFLNNNLKVKFRSYNNYQEIEKTINAFYSFYQLK